MVREPAATVVIPTYGKAAYLELTLTALATQTVDDFEVVVVDDGTPGGIGAAIEGARAAGLTRLTCLTQPNRGRAAARNAALAAASGRVVVFCDDDRIADPDFVAAHVAAVADRGGVSIGWKKRVLTQWIPRVLPLTQDELLVALRLVRDLDRAESLLSPERLHADFGSLSPLSLGDEPDNYAAIVDEFGDDLAGFRLGWCLGTTASLAVPREAVTAVGGFDEAFVGWGIEDTDLCYRLHRRGLPFRVTRAAISHHQLHPTDQAEHPAAVHIQRRQLLANVDRMCRKYDDLEVYLFRRRWEHGMTLAEAHRLLTVLDDPALAVVRRELAAAYGAR